MREIKFCGKAKMPIEQLDSLGIPHENGWVFGACVYNGGEPYIISQNVVESCEEYFHPEWWCPVVPDSVGQFTGLHDKNGKEVYEGDIVKCFDYDGHIKRIGIVEYDPIETLFAVGNDSLQYYVYDSRNPKTMKVYLEVVGKIYENPGLLELLDEINKRCATHSCVNADKGGRCDASQIG